MSVDKSFNGIFLMKFCKTLNDAYKLAKNLKPTEIFIDGDVGVRRFLQLTHFKLMSPAMKINVYEEGLGTYREDLYPAWKRRVFHHFGVGTHFGGSIHCSKVYLYQPDVYVRTFGVRSDKVVKIEKSLLSQIEDLHEPLVATFGQPLVAKQGSDVCHVYLTSWIIDQSFLKSLECLEGDKYFKLHPNFKDDKTIEFATSIAASIPAELALFVLAKSYDTIYVYHHGSSVERYVLNDSIIFEKI